MGLFVNLLLITTTYLLIYLHVLHERHTHKNTVAGMLGMFYEKVPRIFAGRRTFSGISPVSPDDQS